LDAVEAERLYELLEREVIPEFYNRDEHGIPTAWVKRMRESMAQLTPRFSADRTIREYTEQHYLPAAIAYRTRAADNGSIGKKIVDWRFALETKLSKVRFGNLNVQTRDGQYLFEIRVCFNDLDAKSVRVELYADGVMGGDPMRQEMKCLQQPVETQGYIYRISIPASRHTTDYSVRIIPHYDGVAVPLEATHILWQHCV
jgi:starch phosphorylase